MSGTQNILLFIETGGPGGAERVVAGLACGFNELGKNVAVCTLRTGWLTETLAAAGIKHFQIRSERGFDIGLPKRLAGVIKEFNADVLHSHLLDSNFYGAIAAKLAGVRHLATEHGDVHHTERKRFFRVKLKLLSLLNTKFSAVSEFTRGKLIDAGIAPEAVCTIGNPVEIAPPRAGQRNSLRQELKIDPQRDKHWLWLHVANIRPVKDQATLIDGFAQAVKKSSLPQSLIIVGDGTGRAELEALACSKDVAGQVHFAGFQEDVAKWLYAADGFVLTSRSEALPMSMLEAASAGLVLIGTDVGGIPEIIRPDKTGFLFPAGQPAKLAEAFLRCTSNIPHSMTMASNARSHVIREYSTSVILDRFLEAYQF